MDSNKNKETFRIHFHEDQPQKPRTKQKAEKRTVKTILKDAGRQIIASVVILIIGIFLLNFSAYSQIAKLRIERFLGINQETPLDQLIEEDQASRKVAALQSNSNVAEQQNDIPDLDLAIAPIDNRLIIPRIKQNIPVVRVSSEALVERNWDALENQIQSALQNGVVHYPGTSVPGQPGNIAITGHSSYFPWDPGRFKDVFALLHDVVIGDKIVLYWNQKKYIYEIDDVRVVLPEDISVLKQTPNDQLTLITCTPVGTNLKRLIITATPVTEDSKITR